MIWLFPTIITLLGAALLFACGRIENAMAEMMVFIAGMSLTVCGIIMFGLLLAL